MDRRSQPVRSTLPSSASSRPAALARSPSHRARPEPSTEGPADQGIRRVRPAQSRQAPGGQARTDRRPAKTAEDPQPGPAHGLTEKAGMGHPSRLEASEEPARLFHPQTSSAVASLSLILSLASKAPLVTRLR